VVSSQAPAEESELVGAVTVRVKRGAAAKTSATPALTAAVPRNTDARETNGGRETRKTSEKKVPETQAIWGTLSWCDDEGDKVFPLLGFTVTVGRGSQTDVVIRNASEDVSRRHCTLRVDTAGKAWVSDAGSSNGTLLDGVLLAPNIETALPDTSCISLANGVVTLNFMRRGA
jgi:hypothetical protein